MFDRSIKVDHFEGFSLKIHLLKIGFKYMYIIHIFKTYF